jgi:hypothetical protein
MDDDYLWDRSGEPDPDVARLEQTLGRLSYRASTAKQGAATVSTSANERPASAPLVRPRARTRWLVVALAATLALGAWILWPRRDAPPTPVASTPQPSFLVQQLKGSPRVGASAFQGTASLAVGEWLETDPSARARIAVADIGVVDVAERSRVRLTKTGPSQHRLDLDVGSIAVKVDAPPRLFVVGTPSATAVDLGCAYTLDVDARGYGTLRVTSGWVSLEDQGRVSLVAAGAECQSRPKLGLGTPAFDDAPRALRDALAQFDFEDGGANAIADVLKAARPRDALTLWHVLQRVDGVLRGQVYERLRNFVALPADVSDAAVLRLDPAALGKWRVAISSASASIPW